MKTKTTLLAIALNLFTWNINAQLLVKDIKIGSSGANISLIKKVGNRLYFAADDGTKGSEVWISNGTSNGTTILKDVNPSGDGLNKTFFTKFETIGNTLYFVGNNNVNGFELWKTDGSVSGTQLVKDIKVGASGGFMVTREMISHNGFIYFSGDDGTISDELWKSDGTASGTNLVKNIAVTGPSYIENFTVSNDVLFFTANDGNNGQELWKTDGSAAGTVLVKNIASSGGSLPNYLTDVKGTLYFSAYTAANGIELWKSDGTNAGTIMVKDINPGSGSAFSTSAFYNFNGTLYFSATDGSNGEELWKSDGTPEGTVMVKDIRVGTAGGLEISNIQSFMGFNGQLYFLANDGITGVEVWKTDGTTSGTVLVKDIRSGNNTTSDPKELTVFNNSLYFIAYDGINASTLWKSDGTNSGTILAFNKGPKVSKSLIVMGDNLYFRATDSANGEELWKFDGTLGINENYKNDLGITVYPNPSKGIINLELTDLKEAELSIYNVAGQKVLTKKINEKKSRLDLNTLDNGIYFLNFKNNDGTTVKKIILDK